MDANIITGEIIGRAIEVHRTLGPGLLESAYEECLAYELKNMGLKFKRQLKLPIVYKELELDHGYKLDLLVEDKVIVELKCVESFAKVHFAQILTYMKLSDCDLGLLINFNVTVLKHGIKRFKL